MIQLIGYYELSLFDFISYNNVSTLSHVEILLFKMTTRPEYPTLREVHAIELDWFLSPQLVYLSARKYFKDASLFPLTSKSD